MRSHSRRFLRRTFALALICGACAFPALADTLKPEPAPAQGLPTSALVRPVQPDPRQAPVIDVVFVLDTTGSMGGLIEGAKEKIWSIASNIARGQPAPRLRVGLVAYRDVGDAYVTRKFDLSEDLDTVSKHLRSFRAEGGGDTPEHVGRGLGEAVSQMRWTDDRRAMKMIFVVGDAPPQLYDDGWDYRTWAKRAIQKGIIVNTIRCGADGQTEVAWREISRLADGSFVSIGQSGGMVARATPYDADIAKVNAELATKTLYGGKREARAASLDRAREVATMAPAAQADRASYMASMMRAGHAPSSAPPPESGALDLTASPEQVNGLAEDDLPEELRDLKGKAREERVQKLAQERKELESKVQKLARDRDGWLEKNAPAKKDSFDAQVMENVKARAAKIGVKY